MKTLSENDWICSPLVLDQEFIVHLIEGYIETTHESSIVNMRRLYYYRINLYWDDSDPHKARVRANVEWFDRDKGEESNDQSASFTIGTPTNKKASKLWESDL